MVGNYHSYDKDKKIPPPPHVPHPQLEKKFQNKKKKLVESYEKILTKPKKNFTTKISTPTKKISGGG